ncbi:hypothetical protein CBG46_01830 [Actinobacillus succinogenes]|uniref:Pilus assembly protein PilP n=1 Tax=Actinobacillus succinogenes (strain ATCC 55618 / DSM 22257 / CCUG 43843 / 130Z) TaxID=339671 RepID=A6VM65_ACTSZ|nr:pilus assembly protein PilP [Actinobacillus succinogenes]ABR74062.1 conserved hypothetical protein [Actinobacillus succinogenes 130Z]PHI39504.1 hypothetical protein CBG46_01830 [Actinobacillus succinogenes]
MRALSFIFFICAVTTVYAADPFDKNRRGDAPPEQAIAIPSAQRCHSHNSALAEHINFKRLKLVGVLLEKERPKALFQIDEKQIVTAKQGDFIAQEHLQIQQITKTVVQLNRWRLDCDNPERLTLKF